MERSMARYGQLTPVVVGHAAQASRYELVDGFKRFRACRKLGFHVVKARILEGGGRSLKVAIVHLNRSAGSINLLEEAMVVHSLYRDDGLTQEEIAVLFERHKSWVCRRIALVERLSEEVHEHLRLGLLGVSKGRELARLPRGNQEVVLRAVLDHRLTRRETERLVSLILSRPRWEHEALLRFPRETLENERPPEKERPLASRLHQVLEILQKGCDALERDATTAFSSRQRSLVEQGLCGVEQVVLRIRAMIQESPHGVEVHPQS
jgi:ParB/RepB/Spo0J family partition protein